MVLAVTGLVGIGGAVLGVEAALELGVSDLTGEGVAPVDGIVGTALSAGVPSGGMGCPCIKEGCCDGG